MGKKGAKSPKAEAEFERALEQFGSTKNIKIKPTTSERVLNILVGAFTALVPIYLYVAIFGMTLQNFIFVYVGVTLFTAVVLSFAYQNTAVQGWIYLFNTRAGRISKGQSKASKPGKETFKSTAEALLLREARSFAFFKINVIFFLSVVALSALFFFNAAGPLNYSCTLLAASAICLFLSGGATR